MVNALIIDDNLEYSKNLINYLSKNISNIRFTRIISDGNEAINFLKNEISNIDIILLDIKLPYHNGIEILNFLASKNDVKYKDSVIVISGHPNFFKNLSQNEYVYCYINKLNGFDLVLKEVKNLINLKRTSIISIKNKVLEEFSFLNFNDNLVGTKYLFEAILIVIDKYKFKSYNLKTDIYPIIAKRHNKTVHNIKCNITNPTTMMNCDCERKLLKNYFNFCDNKSEAKPKEVIETIIQRIYIKRCS